jgi:Protein of unknown function (DUF2971)
MIADRLFRPNGEEVLYHYCDEASFRGIVSSRTLRASAFYALNDPAERKWGYRVLTDSCKRLRASVDGHFLNNVTGIVDRVYESSMLMVCSLSLHPDSENQWRRYAAARQGFSIGFSASSLRMPAKPLRILYNRARQIDELVGNLRHIYLYQKSLGFPYEAEFQQHCFQLRQDLCAYKDPAYRDEMEVRYAHVAKFSFAFEVIPRCLTLNWTGQTKEESRL